RAGHSVVVFEASATVGGGGRSQELTLPGFTHDVCSAIHACGAASPFMRSLPLKRYGVEWIHPPTPLAHPLDDGTAVLLERSISETGATLGPDAGAWRRLYAPLARRWDGIGDGILGPLRPLHQVQHPFASLAMAGFGLFALQSARGLAKRMFKGERARAIFGGMTAHSMLPLEQPPSAAAGLVLGAFAHIFGWPIAKGG